MNKNTNHISNLTDEVLCALAARHRLRGEGASPLVRPNRFLELFHEYSDLAKAGSEKQIEKAEKARKLKLHKYVYEYLSLKNDKGEATDIIDTE